MLNPHETSKSHKFVGKTPFGRKFDATLYKVLLIPKGNYQQEYPREFRDRDIYLFLDYQNIFFPYVGFGNVVDHSTSWNIIFSVEDVDFYSKHEPTEIKVETLSSEVLYSGHNENSIFLKYREYTDEDLARTPFYQELTYSKKDKIIRFQNFKIEIIDLDNEKINFIVLEDGVDS